MILKTTTAHANPFLTELVAKMAFKAWLRQSKSQVVINQDQDVNVCFDAYEEVLIPL